MGPSPENIYGLVRMNRRASATVGGVLKDIINLIQHKKYRRIILSGIGIGLVTLAAALYELHSSYKLEVERAIVQSDNYSQVLEEQLAVILTKFDLTMSETVRTIENKRGTSSLSVSEIQSVLEERIKDIPEAKTFFVLDKNGYDMHRNKDGSKLYLGDREYFRFQRNSVINQMVISQPLIGRVSGVYSLIFSRKIVDRENKFNGIVAISVPLTFFRDLYSAIDVGKKGSIALGSNENILYARYPWDEKLIGSQVKNMDVVREIFAGNSRVKRLVGESLFDGVVRYSSIRRVGKTKFFIHVGISKDEILSAWRMRSFFYLIGFIIFWFGGAVYLIRFLKSMQELDEKKKMAIQNAKLASLGEMASGIAHEINNPLAVIQSRTLHLKRQIDRGQYDPDNFKESLQKINMTVDRIAKIIRGLKSFSRNADGDPLTPVSLKTIVENTLELCSEKFRNNQVIFKVDPIPDITIHCREAQIVQVLLNLLNNAFDAVEMKEERWVHLSFNMMRRNHISIIVTDCGDGIPDSVAQNIMQPFFTTKDVGKGTGLGLSISKGIVDSHQGELYLDKKNRNTRFVISLPVSHVNYDGLSEAG